MRGDHLEQVPEIERPVKHDPVNLVVAHEPGPHEVLGKVLQLDPLSFQLVKGDPRAFEKIDRGRVGVVFAGG